jgi:hypothetical protein
MLTALILICSLASTPDLRDCSRANAVDVLMTPVAFANPATCFMQGQAYLAETSIGRDLTENERVKIVCVHKVAVETGRSVADTAKPALQQP